MVMLADGGCCCGKRVYRSRWKSNLILDEHFVQTTFNQSLLYFWFAISRRLHVSRAPSSLKRGQVLYIHICTCLCTPSTHIFGHMCTYAGTLLDSGHVRKDVLSFYEIFCSSMINVSNRKNSLLSRTT